MAEECLDAARLLLQAKMMGLGFGQPGVTAGVMGMQLDIDVDDDGLMDIRQQVSVNNIDVQLTDPNPPNHNFMGVRPDTVHMWCSTETPL